MNGGWQGECAHPYLRLRSGSRDGSVGELRAVTGRDGLAECRAEAGVHRRGDAEKDAPVRRAGLPGGSIFPD